MIPFSDFQSKQNPADSLFICPLGADCQRGFASIVVCPHLPFLQHWPFRHAPRDGMAELRRSTFPSRNDALPPHQTACPPLPIHLASTGAKIRKRGGAIYAQMVSCTYFQLINFISSILIHQFINSPQGGGGGGGGDMAAARRAATRRKAARRAATRRARRRGGGRRGGGQRRGGEAYRQG